MTELSDPLDDWLDALKRRQAERDALLHQIEVALRADERVVAAWLTGSLGRGNADALSDIDLWVIVRDDAVAAIATDPRGFVAGIAVMKWWMGLKRFLRLRGF